MITTATAQARPAARRAPPRTRPSRREGWRPAAGDGRRAAPFPPGRPTAAPGATLAPFAAARGAAWDAAWDAARDAARACVVAGTSGPADRPGAAGAPATPAREAASPALMASGWGRPARCLAEWAPRLAIRAIGCHCAT